MADSKFVLQKRQIRFLGDKGYETLHAGDELTGAQVKKLPERVQKFFAKKEAPKKETSKKETSKEETSKEETK